MISRAFIKENKHIVNTLFYNNLNKKCESIGTLWIGKLKSKKKMSEVNFELLVRQYTVHVQLTTENKPCFRFSYCIALFESQI